MYINSYFSSSSFENFLKILGFLEQSNPNTSTSVFTFFAKAYKVGFFPANPIYRVLTDVTPCIRIVVPEPIVIQSRLCILILPLVLEWNERRRAFPLPPVDVQLLFPHLVSLFVVGLQGRAEVVGDDGETAAVGNKLGSRHERVLLEEPGDHAFFCFFRPFMQGNVAVPHEVGG